MSFTYHLDRSAGILVIVGKGQVTQAERLATITAILADPAYRGDMNTLCDVSESLSPATLPELREIITLIKGGAYFSEDKKVAIVAPRLAAFGAARQFQTMLDSAPGQIRVFRFREAALKWLLQEDAD